MHQGSRHPPHRSVITALGPTRSKEAMSESEERARTKKSADTNAWTVELRGKSMW